MIPGQPNLMIPGQSNIAPENCWLEDEFPFEMAYIQGLC